MKKVLKKIAKREGVSVKQIKREMQEAIDWAYTNCPSDGITIAYQNRVPCKGKIPTIDEFMRYCIQEQKEKSMYSLK